MVLGSPLPTRRGPDSAPLPRQPHGSDLAAGPGEHGPGPGGTVAPDRARHRSDSVGVTVTEWGRGGPAVPVA